MTTRKTATEQTAQTEPTNDPVLDSAQIAALIAMIDSPMLANMIAMFASAQGASPTALEKLFWAQPAAADHAARRISLTDALANTDAALCAYLDDVRAGLLAQAGDIAAARDIAHDKADRYAQAIRAAIGAHTAIGSRLANADAARGGRTTQTAPGQSVAGRGRGNGNSRIQHVAYDGKADTIWRALSCNVRADSVHAICNAPGMTHTITIPMIRRADGAPDAAAACTRAIKWYAMICHYYAQSRPDAFAPGYWGNSYDAVVRADCWAGKINGAGAGGADWRKWTPATTDDDAIAMTMAYPSLRGINQYSMVWRDVDPFVPHAPRD